MARTTQLKPEVVNAQIHALVSAGQYPNPQELHRALGGGGVVVLQGFIRKWFQDNGPALAANAKTLAAAKKPAAEGLQDQLKRFTKDALTELETARQEQEQVLADAKAAQEAALAQRSTELDDRAAALETREAALLGREQAQDQRELDQLELVTRLRAEADEARARAVDAEAQREIERQGQIEAERAAAAAREALAAAEANVAAQRQQLANLEERAQALIAEVRRLSGLDVEVRHARNDVEHSRRQVLDLMEQLKRATVTLDACRGDRDAAEERLATVQATLSDTRVELVTARAKLESADATERLLAADKAALQAALDAAGVEQQRSLNALSERVDKLIDVQRLDRQLRETPPTPRSKG